MEGASFTGKDAKKKGTSQKGRGGDTRSPSETPDRCCLFAPSESFGRRRVHASVFDSIPVAREETTRRDGTTDSRSSIGAGSGCRIDSWEIHAFPESG